MSDEAAPVAAPAAAEAPTQAPAQDKPAEKPESAKGDGKPAAETKAEKARRLALKVDGEEEELDLENAEHLAKLQKLAQLGKAKDKRFEEAKSLKAKADEQEGKIRGLLKAMREQPREFARAAREHGLDPIEFAKAVLQPVIEEQLEQERLASMSAEEKRLHELERKVKEYEAKESERQEKEKLSKAEEEKVAHEAKVAKRADAISDTVMGALEKTSLPKTQRTALMLTDLMEVALENGLTPDPADLAAELEQMVRAETQALLDQANDEQLTSIIGKKAQERMRMATVRAFKKGNPLLEGKSEVAEGARAQEKPKLKFGTLTATARDIALGKF